MNGRNQEVQSVDFRLTDEQAMTRDMVREFAQEEVKPAAFLLDAKKDPKDCIPWDLIKKASQMGLRTTAIPEKWGGEGADYPTLAIILEELGAADHGFATILRGCYTESPRLIAELSDEQRDEFLPKFLKDDTFLLGLARTEPDAGTDSHYLYDEPGASIRTFAERRGDEYVINGTKHFISCGGVAKLYFLYARTDKKGPISTSLSLFLMPSDAPGFSIGRFHNKLGRRLLPNAELVFEDARIPARYLVGEEGDAWGSEGEGGGGPQKDWANTKAGAPPPFGLLGAAVNLGTVRGCYEEALNYSRNRFQGGKKIIEHHHVAMSLARMKVQIEAARALLWKTAWSWETKCDYDPKMGMLLKAYVDEMGLGVANHAVSIFGGLGTADDDVPIQKYLRDVYTFLHGFATTEVALLIGAPTA
jgi:alkylation response protein AidB-like acyl-CoA dehydrogenase